MKLNPLNVIELIKAQIQLKTILAIHMQNLFISSNKKLL